MPARDEALDLDNVNTICVLCWGLIGDVFVRAATIEALKRRYPRARLTVVVDPGSRDVLANHPDCDEVYVFPRRKRPLWDYVAGSLQHIRTLHRRRFDLSVNLYSGGSSPRITRWIDARVRLGFDHTVALRRANNLRAPHPSMCGNWYQAFGTVLAPLGVAPDSIRRGTSFYCTDDARRYAAELLQAQRGPLAVFNLGAGSADKRWPVVNYAALARHVFQRHGVTPLVLTNPGMETLAQDFVRACTDAVPVQHLPRMSLDQVGAVMERCVTVVTGDTSIMHLAFGLKRPTLVLFTSTRPEIVAPQDCVHVPCFVEDPRRTDACGQPLGTQAIPLEYVATRYDELIAAAGVATNPSAASDR